MPPQMNPMPRPLSSPRVRFPRAALFLTCLLSLLVGPLACYEERYHPGGQPPETPGPDASTPTVPANHPVVPPEGAVRIAAFNVHRFFDMNCDSGWCGGSEYEELPTWEAFNAKADRIATAISPMNADVVLVAEVETQASMDALQSRLPEFPYARLGEIGSPASVDVGVLSRFPITGFRPHRNDREFQRPNGGGPTFSREFPEVHLDVEGSHVIVFPAHFRSKVNDDPSRRLAEAEAARTILLRVSAEHPRALVVMGGDLNDTPGSEPLEAMERDGALLRVSSDRPESTVGTYFYGGTRQAIDHLYMVRDGGGRYIPGSFRTVRDSNQGLGGSDHAAVVADFELP